MIDDALVEVFAEELRPLTLGGRKTDRRLATKTNFLDWVADRLGWDRTDTRLVSATETMFAGVVRNSAESLAASGYGRRTAHDDDCYIVGIAECMERVDSRWFQDLLGHDTGARRRYEKGRGRDPKLEQSKNLRFELWINKQLSPTAIYHHKQIGLGKLIHAIDALLDDPRRVKEILAGLQREAGISTLEVEPAEALHPVALSAAAPAPTHAGIPYQHADPYLHEVARGLGVSIRIQLTKQESNHRIPDNELPVRWTTIHDGRADFFERVLRGTAGHPSMLDGEFPRIAETFDKTPSRRLVILGSPGSGKTILAARLALDLLRREPVSDRLIVPVVVNLSSWQEEGTDFWLWFAAQVAERYLVSPWRPWRTRKYWFKLAQQLVDTRLVMPILEGLDEVEPDLQLGFMEALNSALGRDDLVVLTSRADEYEAVTRQAEPLTAGAVIQLNDLDPDRVLDDHLVRSQVGETYTSSWGPFAKEIRHSPSDRGAELLAMLRRPFVVYLAREAYRRRTTDPLELLDTERFPDEPAINKRLLDAHIPTAYHDADPEKAKLRLGLVAGRIEHNHDQNIAWWSLCTPPNQVLRSPGAERAGALGMILTLIGMAYIVVKAMGGADNANIDVVFLVVLFTGLTLGLSSFLYLLPYEAVSIWQEDQKERPRSARFEQFYDMLSRGFGVSVRARRIIYALVTLYLFVLLGYHFFTNSTIDQNLILIPLMFVVSFAFGSEIIPMFGVSRLIPLYQARAWFAFSGRTLQSLNSFLDDAYRRGVLRRVGAIYQFRHQLLFDYLLNEENLRRTQAGRSSRAG